MPKMDVDLNLFIGDRYDNKNDRVVMFIRNDKDSDYSTLNLVQDGIEITFFVDHHLSSVQYLNQLIQIVSELQDVILHRIEKETEE